MQDPYAWLEDLSDPRVIEWALTESKRATEYVRPVSDALYPRMLRAYTLPQLGMFAVTERGYYFVYKGRGYSVKLLGRDGEVSDIVREGELGPDALIAAVYAPSDGRLLAYFYTTAGRDEGILRIVDPETGEEVDKVEGRVWSAVLLDGDAVYYTKMHRKEPCPPDGTQPPCSRVYLKKLGGAEEPVFGEGLRAPYIVSMAPSSDRSRALVTVSYGWSGSVVYGGLLRDPASWRRVYGDFGYVSRPIDYSPDAGCYLVASYGGEGMGEVLCVSEDGKASTLVPEREEYLDGAVMLGSTLALIYVKRACSHYVRYYKVSGELAGIYDPGQPYSINLASWPLRGEAVAVMTSFAIPYRAVRLSEGSVSPSTLLESGQVVSDVVVEDGWARSADGTMIHYFRVRKRGSRGPVLAYGYGGFAIPLTPRFLPWAIPFLEDGGVLVVANLRGGSEYGEKWHRAGMRENKVRVFEDFASVISREREQGAAKVAAIGASNGGLLVAATMVMWPELLDAAVIGYPVIDMLRFHKLYVGLLWTSEYGDPDKPEDRRFLEKYSPYHNLKPGARYPPAFIYTGLNDDRVHPAHAFKFHAKLKELGQESCLRVETASGHMGASPEVRAREASDYMAFVYMKLGLSPGSARG
ncbi:MAG: prolyl oligopeptidase family serine peptidase [Thermoproteota archaeon]